MSSESNTEPFVAHYYIEDHLPTTSKDHVESSLLHYRAFVGPHDKFDLIGALQFHMLVALGLREQHTLLDIGCGSLRGGRFLIQYLQPEHYFAIEPEVWLVEESIQSEVGQELIQRKHPRFSANRDFNLSVFDRKFDFLLAQSIFSHAARWQIRQCLKNAQQVLHPTGVFAATFFEAEENYQGDSWVYPGITKYRFDWMQSTAAEFGLFCRWIEWPHPSWQSWLLFTPRSNAEQLPTIRFETSNIATVAPRSP